MELIKVSNSSYRKYEELLLKKEQLEKEALDIEKAYLSYFGELIIELYNYQIQCIKIKKMINFCIQKNNKKEKIIKEELDNYINEVMSTYNKHLESLKKDYILVKEAKNISSCDYKKIKKLFHRLAKQIHPDICKQTNYDQNLKDLWNKIISAYDNNDLKKLEELEVLVNKYLEGNEINIEVEDIENKNKELEKKINDIVTSEPYIYKYILSSQEAIDKKKQEYIDEIEEYKEYLEELLNTYEYFNVEEVIN